MDLCPACKRPLPPIRTRSCAECGGRFTATSDRARYCGDRCRMRAYRRRRRSA